MKQLILFVLLIFSIGLNAQCLKYDTDVGEDCGNPHSMEVNVKNNCSSKKYVVALCFDENRRVYRLLSNYVESGKKISNWTCECYNVKVKYWDHNLNDEYAAYRAGQEYLKKCKVNNRIY